MGKHRKTWSESEKIEILHHYRSHGMGKTSKTFNVSSATIYRWIGLYENQGNEESSEGFQLSKDKEILRLQREIQAFKEIVAEKELEIRIKDALLKKKL